MRAVTMINLRFVSGSGDRDRCEFCNLLPAGGCIDRPQFGLSGGLPISVVRTMTLDCVARDVKSDGVGDQGLTDLSRECSGSNLPR